jgi:hypothetical protein
LGRSVGPHPFTVGLWIAISLAEVAVLRKRLRRVESRPGLAIGLSIVRVIGLFAILELANRGNAGREIWQPPLVELGIFAVGTLYWLALTGAFGYGFVRRGDWVGLLPFAAALVVREALTLHSIQEYEIQFAIGPQDKHSFVYPMLQLLFTPLLNDPHWFVMHLNGVLGALACLFAYVFVRERLDDRFAAFLVAFFLATHPLVARLAPTDGANSLLLLSWFWGLAVLSTQDLDFGALLGGGALLGAAATLRGEGSVLLVASLFLLDRRRLLDGVRRNPLAALGAVLIIVFMVVVQLSAIMRMHLGNLPVVPPPSALVSLLGSYGPVYALLVVAAVVSGAWTGRWYGLATFIAYLVIVAPVLGATDPSALHRLSPSAALHAAVAGLGAYALAASWGRLRRGGWLVVLPGVLVALAVLVRHRDDLTRRYSFQEEYELVRSRLAPNGVVRSDCVLLAFASEPEIDIDLHYYSQVVPGMRVVECRQDDCTREAAAAECVYYFRSAAAYFHGSVRGYHLGLAVPSFCKEEGLAKRADGTTCLNAAAASFEATVTLEPVELRTVDLRGTFDLPGFPRRAELGLFRVSARTDGATG